MTTPTNHKPHLTPRIVFRGSMILIMWIVCLVVGLQALVGGNIAGGVVALTPSAWLFWYIFIRTTPPRCEHCGSLMD